MDALNSDRYLNAYVEHIDKLDQMDGNTWMDDVDDAEVGALDRALNEFVVPPFAVAQHDNQPLDRLMI
jgi:hypothetical protein